MRPRLKGKALNLAAAVIQAQLWLRSPPNDASLDRQKKHGSEPAKQTHPGAGPDELAHVRTDARDVVFPRISCATELLRAQRNQAAPIAKHQLGITPLPS